jgi:DNA-directed RNA polymerase
LQHYAALGRDEAGAYSVNLIPSDRPQDVYSAVLEKVIEKLTLDSKENENENENKESVNTDETKTKNKDYAKFLLNLVSRKVIKQTVMTSVYGVTKIGARDQVRARVMELVFPEKSSQINDAVLESFVYHSSAYLADITLESLAEMFSSANEIMEWLSVCASLVAQNGQAMSWITPLGLPVIQPYRKSSAYVVKTLLQDVTLSLDDESLPVLRKKQSSAFPPNFVHSLDSTHMMMTSLKTKSARITFAAVHDSFWTHAGDIPILNKVSIYFNLLSYK